MVAVYAGDVIEVKNRVAEMPSGLIMEALSSHRELSFGDVLPGSPQKIVVTPTIAPSSGDQKPVDAPTLRVWNFAAGPELPQVYRLEH